MLVLELGWVRTHMVSLRVLKGLEIFANVHRLSPCYWIFLTIFLGKIK